MMWLAIVGSVGPWSPEKAREAERIARDAIVRFEPDVIVSGGAEGIDTLAETLADELGLSKLIRRPRNRRWSPDGFKDRNLIIAKVCNALVSIRSKRSMTYGSGWTADRAEELGKTVERHLL